MVLGNSHTLKIKKTEKDEIMYGCRGVCDGCVWMREKESNQGQKAGRPRKSAFKEPILEILF